jgi:hypothetical protein
VLAPFLSGFDDVRVLFGWINFMASAFSFFHDEYGKIRWMLVLSMVLQGFGVAGLVLKKDEGSGRNELEMTHVF